MRRSCPVQTADDEEDDADKCLAGIDDDATTQLICGQGPHQNSEKVAAAIEKGSAMEACSKGLVCVLREDDSAEKGVFQSSEGEEICAISDLFQER
jgi:hypothetical protein